MVLEYEVQNNTFRKIENAAICHISVALISNLTARKAFEILKIVKWINRKGSLPSDKVKIGFSDDPSQSMLRPIYGIR